MVNFGEVNRLPNMHERHSRSENFLSKKNIANNYKSPKLFYARQWAFFTLSIVGLEEFREHYICFEWLGI